jgi:hypothetical protein
MKSLVLLSELLTGKAYQLSELILLVNSNRFLQVRMCYLFNRICDGIIHRNQYARSNTKTYSRSNSLCAHSINIAVFQCVGCKGMSKFKTII